MPLRLREGIVPRENLGSGTVSTHQRSAIHFCDNGIMQVAVGLDQI
jgi:hypothetical protein